MSVVRAVAEILAGLSRSYLFEGMTREQLDPLASVVTTRACVRGEYVWHVGDPAGELYVVLRGEVQDFVLDADGRQVVHLVHGPGMTIGEPGYFAAERNRTVANMAVAPTTLIRLGRRDLASFMDRYPRVKDRALGGLPRRCAGRDCHGIAGDLAAHRSRCAEVDRTGRLGLERSRGLAVTPEV
jgi:CRP-like cAMP-binding protein